MILLVRFQKLHQSANFALVCAKVLNAIRHLNGRVGFWYAKINFNTLTIIFKNFWYYYRMVFVWFIKHSNIFKLFLSVVNIYSGCH